MREYKINIGDDWNKELPLKVEWAFSVPHFQDAEDWSIIGNDITYNLPLTEDMNGFYVILKVSQNDRNDILYREYHII